MCRPGPGRPPPHRAKARAQQHPAFHPDRPLRLACPPSTSRPGKGGLRPVLRPYEPAGTPGQGAHTRRRAPLHTPRQARNSPVLPRRRNNPRGAAPSSATAPGRQPDAAGCCPGPATPGGGCPGYRHGTVAQPRTTPPNSQSSPTTRTAPAASPRGGVAAAQQRPAGEHPQATGCGRRPGRSSGGQRQRTNPAGGRISPNNAEQLRTTRPPAGMQRTTGPCGKAAARHGSCRTSPQPVPGRAGARLGDPSVCRAVAQHTRAALLI